MAHFLIRVDGSESIGTGHIMRCLALATELKNCGNRVTFLLALCPELLKERLFDEGYSVSFLPLETALGSEVDARLTVELAQELEADQIVIDGYHFLTTYQRLLKRANFRLLYIDDLAHCDYYCADFVLNQNPSANESLYVNCEPHTRLLLGARYVLLRSEFPAYKKTNQNLEIAPLANKILVTMGGSDIDNVTGMVIEALSFAESRLALQVTAVIGAGNTHAARLQKLAHKLNQAKTHNFKTLVNAREMPELLGAADLVISAGGTTVWEAAYLARPTAVIITADNQAAGMRYFAHEGAVVNLGRQQDLTSRSLCEPLAHLIKDGPGRKQIAGKAALIIDGLGAGRVVQELATKAI